MDPHADQHPDQLERDLSSSPESPGSKPNAKKEPKSEREKRTYRACLHCRQRKSRCDLYVLTVPHLPHGVLQMPSGSELVSVACVVSRCP